MSGWERRLAIGCLLLGVVLLFVGGSDVLVEQKVTGSASYPLIAGLALVISYVILDPTAARDLVSSRRSRFGTLSVLVTAVVVGILVAVNVLAARSSQSLDLTRYQINTLAPESVDVAHRLTSEADITLWDNSSDSSYQTVDTLLARYQAASARIKLTVIDPNNDPATARSQGVTALDTVVIRYQGKSQILGAGSQGESDITAALLKLESVRTPVVCWAGGDGEADLTNTDPLLGYSEASNQILKDNFTIQNLLLSQAATIPTSCDLVAIVRPTAVLPDATVKVLTSYLAGGGRLLIALDPWQDTKVIASYNSVLAAFGLAFDGGLVVPDAADHANNEPTAVAVVDYGSSPIATGLNNRVSFFPETTAINSTSNAAVTTTAVAQTNSSSFLITTPRQPPFTQQTGDKAGPFTIMETGEMAGTGTRKSRVVAVGTGAFAENEALLAQGENVQLLTGSLDYLTDQEQLISIPPKPSTAKTLSLTQEQQNLNLWLTLLLMPLLVALGGIAVWWRRRLT
ncbi:MAG TPA: GldG family protein [Candidatus Dormibacteraeota bacterium]|nr:GldG family protein [Candidatus Dormibacteraeota bacterium]